MPRGVSLAMLSGALNVAVAVTSERVVTFCWSGQVALVSFDSVYFPAARFVATAGPRLAVRLTNGA